jgi:hypothetical protein
MPRQLKQARRVFVLGTWHHAWMCAAATLRRRRLGVRRLKINRCVKALLSSYHAWMRTTRTLQQQRVRMRAMKRKQQTCALRAWHGAWVEGAMLMRRLSVRMGRIVALNKRHLGRAVLSGWRAYAYAVGKSKVRRLMSHYSREGCMYIL